jgi:hypothetical protein
MLKTFRQRLASFRQRAACESGVSMPEVLTVCMIIGILVGISAGPSFTSCNGTGGRTADVTPKAVARAAASAMEVYANENLGAYDGANPTILKTIDPNLPSNMEVFGYAGCTGNPGGDTCFSVRTPSGLTETTNRFQLLKKRDGKLVSDCNDRGRAGCPTTGKWSAE